MISSRVWLLTGSLIIAAAGASAATVDFTDSSIYSARSSAEATGSVAGYDFVVTGSRNALTFPETGINGPVGPLAGELDGIGIGDDEIGGSEYVTISFDRSVRITGVYFLDLFQARNGSSSETAAIYSGTPPTGANFLQAFSATEIYLSSDTGYGAFEVDFTGSVFTFDAGTGNDGIGIGDFALGGIEIAPIPLPAGAVLLGTALLGLGLSRRRR